MVHAKLTEHGRSPILLQGAFNIIQKLFTWYAMHYLCISNSFQAFTYNLSWYISNTLIDCNKPHKAIQEMMLSLDQQQQHFQPTQSFQQFYLNHQLAQENINLHLRPSSTSTTGYHEKLLSWAWPYRRPACQALKIVADLFNKSWLDPTRYGETGFLSA